MRATNVFRLLVTYFVTLGLLTNCVKSADEKAAREERGRLAAQQTAVSAEAKALKEKQDQLAAAQSELDKKIEDLNKAKTEWEGDRSTRELQLTELSQTILARTSELNALDTEVTELRKEVEKERSSIESAREALIAERQAAQKELESHRLEFENSTQAEKNALQEKIEMAEAKIRNLTEKESNLDDREKNIVKSEQDLSAREAQQKELAGEIEKRQLKFDQVVADTREMFSKEGLGDVLKGVEEGQNFQFLVSLEGRGDRSFIERYREEIKSLNAGSPTKNFNLSKLSETQVRTGKDKKIVSGVNFVDDNFIVFTNVETVRKFRDTLFATMQIAADKGVESYRTQLFAVVRPINKIRFGLELVLSGSKALGFEDRKSDVVLRLGRLRAGESKTHLIKQSDLSNPSKYVFKREEDAERCKRLDSVCLNELVSQGFLDTDYSIGRGSDEEFSNSTVSGREFLAEILAASAAQMRADADLFGSNLSLLGMSYSVESDSNTVGLDTQNIKKVLELKAGNGLVKKLAGLLFGMGEERAPIVDSIRLKYKISMVDSVNVGGNHLDTWKYMGAGSILNSPVYELGHSRDEIEIQLPVQGLTEVATEFADLNLKDFTFNKQAPEKPKARSNSDFARYNKELDKFNREKSTSKRKVYKDRLIKNAGVQEVLRDQLIPGSISK